MSMDKILQIIQKYCLMSLYTHINQHKTLVHFHHLGHITVDISSDYDILYTSNFTSIYNSCFLYTQRVKLFINFSHICLGIFHSSPVRFDCDATDNESWITRSYVEAEIKERKKTYEFVRMKIKICI